MFKRNITLWNLFIIGFIDLFFFLLLNWLLWILNLSFFDKNGYVFQHIGLLSFFLNSGLRFFDQDNHWLKGNSVYEGLWDLRHTELFVFQLHQLAQALNCFELVKNRFLLM